MPGVVLLFVSTCSSFHTKIARTASKGAVRAIHSLLCCSLTVHSLARKISVRIYLSFQCALRLVCNERCRVHESLPCTSKKPTGGSNSCGLCQSSYYVHLTNFLLLQ